MAKASAQAQPPTNLWTASQAYVLAAITLVVGIGIGWLVHGSYSDSQQQRTTTAASAPAPSAPSTGGFQVPTFNGQPGRLSLDDINKAAAPMIAQLQQRPNDPDLLAKLGNHYYDSQAFPQAIAYYQKSLAIAPSNPDVRTDMGTAMFYNGDPDGALKEFATSLSYAPTHAETMFNRGVVLMQGKNDPKAAIASWQELLKTNPNYQDRPKVEASIADAQKRVK
ncbi:Tetratricopeptide repeat protein [Candidatus Koribacter versatilis Ellin345]|uniref:Tetratricopeptide repeat protein n=1 Tax=Koribacter versatilis (strain Ellin345) TaxID=204669 RepID=Q1ITN8_KORVE|nr:tetratricopeptide repeat protein [Candidatus Koribacter versatilis]ABF39762.1 Tetratricopeptide repeat protein [Candidatus Koribacter versatilis Ellin345]